MTNSIVQFPHSTMIDAETLKTVRSRAQLGALGELESLLWFRERVDEFKAEGRLMQAYEEYSDAMMIAKDSLRRKVATVRNYAADNLCAWIESGFGFEHIETANTLAELSKRTPKQLLDEALSYGGENGKPMTVDELTIFALGEKRRDPALFRVNALLSRLSKFPTLLKWGAEKAQKFNDWLNAGREFFQ